MTRVETQDWRQDVGRCVRLAPRPVHFVGVGNPLRGDDGAGIVVASLLRRSLRGSGPRWAKVHPPSRSPDLVLSRIPPGDGIVILDAVEAGRGPGGVVCASLGDTRFGFFATHNIPLRAVPGLSERRDRVFVVGIEPGSLEVGEGLSPAVRASAEVLAAEIARQVGLPND